jgi:hypothetical protein
LTPEFLNNATPLDIPEIPRRNIFPLFSPKAGENFDGTLLFQRCSCHSAYIFENNLFKPNILERFHRPN